MGTIRATAVMLVVAAIGLACGPGARAFEFQGVWASQQDACAKMFKRDRRVSFVKNADAYGSGFIVEANRIRGRIATCTIKSRKQDGAVLHLIAACSTDIALQDVQFSIKPEGDDKIVRLYPGVPELDRPYYRCALP